MQKLLSLEDLRIFFGLQQNNKIDLSKISRYYVNGPVFRVFKKNQITHDY